MALEPREAKLGGFVALLSINSFNQRFGLEQSERLKVTIRIGTNKGPTAILLQETELDIGYGIAMLVRAAP